METKGHKERLTLWLACLIMVSWSVAFLRTQIDSSYEIPIGVTPLMLSLASWCFAGDVVRKIKKITTTEDVADEETQG